MLQVYFYMCFCLNKLIHRVITPVVIEKDFTLFKMCNCMCIKYTTSSMKVLLI